MKVVRIGKATQGFVLASYTALILGVTLLLQGRPGVKTNLDPFDDIHRLYSRASQGEFLSNSFFYAVVGIVGNLAMFAAWGFIAWKFLDGEDRPAWRAHVETFLAGALFSIGIETVQFFLPTRASDVNDVFWNALGTLVGCVAAHVGKSVTLEWG